MTEINIFSAFFIGIAGGVHCVGMCGGIVAALRTVTPSNEPALPYTLAYNFGRILSYTLALSIKIFKLIGFYRPEKDNQCQRNNNNSDGN